MKVKILSIILVLSVMLTSFSFAFATEYTDNKLNFSSEEANIYDDGVWTPIVDESGLRNMQNGGQYILNVSNLTLSSTLEIDKTVKLSLNGNALCLANGALGSVIKVKEGGKLTVVDSTNIGIITGGKGENINNDTCGGGVYVAKNAVFEMTSGMIYGNTAELGGGLYIEKGGAANLSGNAKIIENTSTGSGGGVFVSDGELSMSGQATISKNTASYGGGVCVSGTLRMSENASIVSNTASERGGGVYVAFNGVVEAGGQSFISDNNSHEGGGIYIFSGTASLKSNSNVKNNKANAGGGVYLNSGLLNVQDTANISNNTASFGGGVYALNGNMKMSGGEVSDNTADSDGGVSVDYATLEMSGTSCVIGNTSFSNGGGIGLWYSGVLKVSDSCAITGNIRKNGDTEILNNVYLTKNDGVQKTITIAGKLSNAANIGISADNALGTQIISLQNQQTNISEYVFDDFDAKAFSYDGNSANEKYGFVPAMDASGKGIGFSLQKPAYDLKVNKVGNGTLELNRSNTAVAGDTVKIKSTSYSDIKVTDDSGNNITITDNSFIMPNGNVTITVEYVTEPETPSEPDIPSEPETPSEPDVPTEDKNGWYQLDNKWQYYKDNKLVTGWQNDLPGWSGRWFYFDKTTGFAKSGWVKDIPGWEGQWFYFDAINGTSVMQTGWIQIGNEFYYTNEIGVMQTGWQFLQWSRGKNWFYFGSNGNMYYDTTTPDGYYVNENGVWIDIIYRDRV